MSKYINLSSKIRTKKGVSDFETPFLYLLEKIIQLI